MGVSITAGQASATPTGTAVIASVANAANDTVLITTTSKPFYCTGVFFTGATTLTQYQLQQSVGGGAYTTVVNVVLNNAVTATAFLQGSPSSPVFVLPANSTLIIHNTSFSNDNRVTLWGYTL